MTEPDPISTSRFHRYLLILLGGLVAYIAIAVAINFHFDPWTIYRPLRAKVVPRETNLERVTVAHDLRRADKIDVLLLGSSRVRYMLARQGGEVDNKASAPFFGDRHAYAAGMAGTNIHVMRRVFEHALHYHPIQHLVFLLDDVMLNAYRPTGPGWNEANYYGSPNYQTSIERAVQMVDFSMLQSSVNLWIANMGGETEPEQAVFADPGIQSRWESGIDEFRRRDLYGCFEISDEAISELSRIVALAKQRNVKVTLITSFIHPALFEFFYKADAGKGARRFLNVLRDVAIKYDAPAWFFSPYSPITLGTPRVSYSQESFYSAPDFYDPGHANLQIGTKLFDVAINGRQEPGVEGWRLNDVGVDDVVKGMEPGRARQQSQGGLQILQHVPPMVAGENCPIRRTAVK